MVRSRVCDCTIIELPKSEFSEGNLSVVEGNSFLPFNVKRIFYIYDIPAGQSRGAHSHKKCHQFLIAVSGSFEVEIDDGTEKKSISLNRPFFGLYIPPGIWAHEKLFSGGAICMVLTSNEYDEHDYIRDYSDYFCWISKFSDK
jgi:hypothetical protein